MSLSSLELYIELKIKVKTLMKFRKEMSEGKKKKVGMRDH